MEYEHYIALDWAKSNMAIARMTGKSGKVAIIEGESDIGELKLYLTELKGKKVLTFEETTPSQWLYTELADHVDRVLVCDPFRNKLLSEGPTTDKIAAVKLVKLLRAGLLKEVYHTGHEFVHLRRLASGYEDLIKRGVRLQNQRYALLQVVGKESEKGVQLDHAMEQFVLEKLDKQIKIYEEEKKEYLQIFRGLARKHKQIQHQRSLSGIDYINAVKIVATVIEPHRFPDKGDYLSYAGLIKHDKVSGGRSYGKKNPRYSRELKSVYKTAAITAIKGKNSFNDYYEYLMREKNYPEYQARHALARRIAVLSWGVFKSGKRYRFNNRNKGVTEHRV